MDFGPDIDWLADYLNALEAERDAYRQALEKIANPDWRNQVSPMTIAADALALSSAGRETNT